MAPGFTECSVVLGRLRLRPVGTEKPKCLNYLNYQSSISARRSPNLFRSTNRSTNWSEWGDSNSRPPAPEAGALPGCATLRLAEGVVYRQARQAPQQSLRRALARGGRRASHALLRGADADRRASAHYISEQERRCRPGPRIGGQGCFKSPRRIGAWPSGKATGFGPVIPGSNPGAPATIYAIEIDRSGSPPNPGFFPVFRVRP